MGWGAYGRGRYMEYKKRREEASTGARKLRKTSFDTYALLAAHFSLHTRHAAQQATPRSACLSVTEFTALTLPHGRVLTRIAEGSFCIAIFYAIYLYFQLFTNCFPDVLPSC